MTATPIETGRYYRLRVEATGNELRVLLDGVEMNRVTTSQWAFGSIGLRTFNTITTYDEIRVECPGA